jgi:ankyrin repeat protein
MRIQIWLSTVIFLLLSASAFASGNYVTRPQDKALFEAVGANNMKQAQALLAKGADINAKEKPWGLTPLLIAPDVSKEMVQYLLKNGANVNAADREGITVLMRAVYSRDPEIVADVLEYHPNLEAKGTWNNTALTYAVVQGNPIMVKAIVRAGADVDVTRADGMTPLDMAKRRLMQARIAVQETGAMPNHGSAPMSMQMPMHHGMMQHNVPKAVIIRDSQEVLAIIKGAGGIAGLGFSMDAALLQHNH